MRLVAIFVLLLAPTPLLAFDNVEELKLLTKQELYKRGIGTCFAVVSHREIMRRSRRGITQHDYDQSDDELKSLENIWLVARQKNKGTYPNWVLQQKQALMELVSKQTPMEDDLNFDAEQWKRKLENLCQPPESK